MRSAAQETTVFQRVVEDAAQQLVAVEEVSGAQYVKLPLMYVSGASVVVRVERAGSSTEFLVSDFGSGHQEAEWLGGELTFRRVARSIAGAAGVGFDHFAFFTVRVSSDQLAGAIATVANCSLEAVLVTSTRVAEKRAKDDAAELYDRLSDLFTPRAVTRDASVVGASNTQWHVAALVQAGNRPVAFEAVTKHPNSIYAAVTKFHDISLVKFPPGRVAVVQRKDQLRTYLGVLSQSSDVIEQESADQIFRETVMKAA